MDNFTSLKRKKEHISSFFLPIFAPIIINNKNMKITIRFILAVLLIISDISLAKAQSGKQSSIDSKNEFEVLMEKIRLDFAQNPQIEEALNKYNEKDGSFIDVDYASIRRTEWPPMTHIERLYDFAFAYTNPKNKYYKDSSLFNKIQKGLEFWHERNPWCHNWWYNQIAEPQCLGILLIQMRIGEQRLPAELESKLLKRIKEDGGHPAKWTGANRTDIALHWIYRSCLTQNESDLKIALENAYSPVVYTTKEGFQHDNSYFQHGVQLYIGGYGDEILKGITQVAMYTKGTQYAISEDKLAIVSKFMRETYYSTIRGQHMLFDVLGRGVSRPDITKKTNTILFAKRMIDLDPAHADEFQTIIKRIEGEEPANYGLTPKHTHYFRGDYTLHVRPEYTFDVRIVSNRTMRCEYGNGENLKTYFMSDGCTNIVVDGNEYANIFPVWNWARIPGVTAPQMSDIPKAKSDWQTRGTSTFAGGVSDSIYGASAYSYTDDYANINTRAKKAWFFFDEEVVCLGSGISSTASEEVFTTINQSLLLDKEVTVSSNKKVSTIGKESFSYINPDWILHNKIGYIFPENGNVFVSNRTQNGNWYDINNTASKQSLQKEIFTVGFNHGKKPSNASYAYIIVPGKQTVKDMRKYQKNKNIEILANTEEQQIVRNKELGIWQMIFYQAGEFKNKDIAVKVNQGCALMIKENDKYKVEVHIADPAQTQSIIEADICIPHKSKEIKKICYDFNHSGIYAGASQKREFQY